MIDVLIITYNEALNLPYCLESLRGWTNQIFVVDSGSTDGTQEIARRYGAQVIEHAWEGYARQKNWALKNLPWKADWILIIDADEVVTPELRRRLMEIASRPVNEVRENGFFINRLTYFMDQPIRHCGYFPSWNMRFFKRGKGLYEDRPVHEHIVIDDPVGYIHELMLHNDRRGLEHYFAKHNRYSTLEAQALFDEVIRSRQHQEVANVARTTRRHRWLKRVGMRYIPWPGLWRFLYMYIFRLGILDGWAGLEFCRFISMYDSMVAIKFRELRRRARERLPTSPLSPPASALAVPEGQEITRLPEVQVAAHPLVNISHVQMHPESSPWTLKEKLIRVIWMLIGRPLFKMSFHNWYRFRALLLRLFGARIGRRVSIRPSAHIEIPWLLEIGDDVTIGDYAILYSLAPIRIGNRSIISQYAHLCAGTHDYTDHTFRLVRQPITIGDDVWIGADVFVGPGVTIGALTVVGARSSVYKDLPPGKVCVGNPARPIKDRILR